MSQNYEYEIGRVYGLKRLISLDHVMGEDGYFHTLATVECVNCGKKSIVRPDTLLYNKFTSCTCQLRTSGGASSTRLYGVYHNMKYRCNKETAQGYHNYGGRGIKVCEEWSGKDGFIKFQEWALSSGYREGLSIDRIDVNKGYSPENCRWITKSENTRLANIDNRVQHRKADKGEYYGISPNGEFFRFWNASKFSKEHSLVAGYVRRAANLSRKYNGWTFGFMQDLQNKKTQSTIESRESEQVEYTAGETPAVEAPGTASL